MNVAEAFKRNKIRNSPAGRGGSATGSGPRGWSAARWLQVVCRFGIASLSSLYLLMGGLTAMAAMGMGGAKVDQPALLPFLYRQPLGRIGLFILASGMLAYVFWRITQVIVDPAGYGWGPKGICLRISFLVSAGIYASFSTFAYSMVWKGRPRHASQNIPVVVGDLLQPPFGREWVRAVALIIFIVGVVQIQRALTLRFRRQIPDPDFNRKHDVLIRWTGRLGFTARGVVMFVIAWLFLKAAEHANPREAGGIDQAWNFLETGPWGHILLALVALGLAFYGLFLGVKAWGLQSDLIG